MSGKESGHEPHGARPARDHEGSPIGALVGMVAMRLRRYWDLQLDRYVAGEITKRLRREARWQELEVWRDRLDEVRPVD